MAIELNTGKVLHSWDGVGDATAPFIVGNKLYSYIHGVISEIDINTFAITNKINIANAFYSENMPYDSETGYFFIRQAIEDQYIGRLSAFNLSGQLIWSYPADLTGGFDDHQSPIVIGDSVFFQTSDAFWEERNIFSRLNKETGTVIWETTLSSGSSSRGGYNNPIYDKDHDVIYVSESWNNGTSKVYAIRRSDGAILWSHGFSGDKNIESTLTYYNNVVYVPLHNFTSGGVGHYAALNASDGSLIWEKPGFFNEDGWSATAVDDRYLYRLAHGTGNRIIIQDKVTGDLVWSAETDAPAPCFNPIASNGIILVGSETSVYAIKAGTGQALDSDFHGLNSTGFNPGAIIWGSSPSITPSPTLPFCLDFPKGDVNNDCQINAQDLTNIIKAWGRSTPAVIRPEDIDQNSVVNAEDVAIVLINFGK